MKERESEAADEVRERGLRAAGFDVVRYDIDRESPDPHTLAEAIAHEARIRIERGDFPSPPAPLPQAGEGSQSCASLSIQSGTISAFSCA